MKNSSIFTQEFSKNPSQWLVLGVLAVFKSLCELGFLGLLREEAAQLLGKTSYLQLGIWETTLSLVVILAFRFCFQKIYLSKALKMQGEFRENREYLFESEPLWVERREKQRVLDESYQAAQWHIYSWMHLLVFLPALFVNDWSLFLAFLVCFAPILWLGKQLRKRVKSQALGFSKERRKIFGKMDQSLRFLNQWTHSKIQSETKTQVEVWLKHWSSSELEFRRQNETAQLKLELLNSMAFVLVITLCIVGTNQDYFEPTAIIFFMTAVLISYDPLKKIQTFQNSQIQSQVEMDNTQINGSLDVVLNGQIKISKELIALQDLEIGYQQPLQSTPLNTTFDQGIHFVQGENGAGKSTLVDAMLASQPGGLVSLNQIPILPPFEVLSKVWDEVSSEIKSHFQVDIEVQDQEFSGGESQKLLLLIALSQSSDWFLFDEPFSHIDLGTRTLWFDLLAKWAIKKELNLIVIHHESLKHLVELNHWWLDVEGLSRC